MEAAVVGFIFAHFYFCTLFRVVGRRGSKILLCDGAQILSFTLWLWWQTEVPIWKTIIPCNITFYRVGEPVSIKPYEKDFFPIKLSVISPKITLLQRPINLLAGMLSTRYLYILKASRLSVGPSMNILPHHLTFEYISNHLYLFCKNVAPSPECKQTYK